MSARESIPFYVYAALSLGSFMVNLWPEYVFEASTYRSVPMPPPSFIEFLWTNLLKHPAIIFMIYGSPIVVLALFYNCLSLQLVVLSTQMLFTFLEVLELYQRWGDWGRDPLVGLFVRGSFSFTCLLLSPIALVMLVPWVLDRNAVRKK